MPSLCSSLLELVGQSAQPTEIQALSLVHSLRDKPLPQYSLLASETGSGKSIAYLLPLLQTLKISELDGSSQCQPSKATYSPRAVVLAPTHELSRQLSSFAKALSHGIKLRIVCASRANTPSTSKSLERTHGGMRASKMSHGFGSGVIYDNAPSTDAVCIVDQTKQGRPVDVVVGTPMKLLEMSRGRGWDRTQDKHDQRVRMDDEVEGPESEDLASSQPRRRGIDVKGGTCTTMSPEISFENVEWVIIDEADVLFDRDFQETTRLLLADISAARGVRIDYTAQSSLSIAAPYETGKMPVGDTSDVQQSETDVERIDYPFRLTLSSATIPTALYKYLKRHHPDISILAASNLHHLPKNLKTQHVGWSGGNKNADIEKQIRTIWSNNATNAYSKGIREPTLSKILIFCNKSSKVADLSQYLEQKGIRTVALSSSSVQRRRGSNKHLDGFLQPHARTGTLPIHNGPPASPQDVPHVMITTSLLSRGLDFLPSINVFIVDEPRNTIDFLHRAGRSGRAGHKGRVYLFSRMSGRGSERAREVRKRVSSLVRRA
ncbi:P-loop containing nucleoside triphosphate hydrolase protein [Fistulina hepatica ATCC 64428]|uniref:RNA helicase n=1 Tax=Fistulina hepatica ATCC 64428 TaxID=1128425 RepID=A0A0D7APC3_9AGAR|nr:P-loop containing nucleoside triphosphate hydrolase protein [Fistulina hepatica ATCC 64428]